ncbi:MAG TPA: type IVB secretion system protein IcmH/DotU [Burkholderiales bacterium]|nr:type IVB secretion system protein IcmH/DotU [Burkholderiales bacterium]
MAEDSKQPFDPDATVRQPAGALDPDATPIRPVTPLTEPDPEATLQGGQPAFDPAFDPEATSPTQAAFDPEATFNPAQRVALEDPEATIRIPSPGKKRKRNPFAPHGRIESLTANLSALGGLNPLIALANPILGVVPQIRRALKHPDPAQLRATLRDQVEGFQTSATFADIPSRQVEWAVYALCALLDESAASTPWGADWADKGLLHELRGESGADEGFFALLERLTHDPDGNAELIEFFYVCMALGFEGRFRKADGGARHELGRTRDRIYALISQRRPRPRDGLSEHWRSPLDPLAAKQPERAAAPQAPAPVARVRAMPLRAKLSAAAAILGTVLVGYLVAIRLPVSHSPEPAKPAVAAPAEAKDATPIQTPTLAREVGAGAVVSEQGGSVRIALRSARQFPVGAADPAPELRPVIARIAKALDRTPGAIVVIGHADATPAHLRSNQDISLARARSVAGLISGVLADPSRVRIEGRGEAEPVAPNDTEANRARNRRVVIEVRKAP